VNPPIFSAASWRFFLTYSKEAPFYSSFFLTLPNQFSCFTEALGHIVCFPALAAYQVQIWISIDDISKNKKSQTVKLKYLKYRPVKTLKWYNFSKTWKTQNKHYLYQRGLDLGSFQHHLQKFLHRLLLLALQYFPQYYHHQHSK